MTAHAPITFVSDEVLDMEPWELPCLSEATNRSRSERSWAKGLDSGRAVVFESVSDKEYAHSYEYTGDGSEGLWPGLLEMGTSGPSEGQQRHVGGEDDNVSWV